MVESMLSLSSQLWYEVREVFDWALPLYRNKLGERKEHAEKKREKTTDSFFGIGCTNTGMRESILLHGD
jgi:hypothetical protein